MKKERVGRNAEIFFFSLILFFFLSPFLALFGLFLRVVLCCEPYQGIVVSIVVA